MLDKERDGHVCEDFEETRTEKVEPNAEGDGAPGYHFERRYCGRCKRWLGDLPAVLHETAA